MRVRPFADWSLASKVVGSLSCALLPLGVLATMVTASAYHQILLHRGHVSIERWVGLALPLAMWLSALLIGSIIADRLLIRPLTQMRRMVSRYGHGETSVRLGSIAFYSREMTALAAAFDRMADDTGRHEEKLRNSLDEQRRLTREVHHRVKNNLQIVSSLLSLQARETTSAEVARAYSTVQARVGALALVHRWMYDDEGAHGVDFRALTTDLCAALEQSITATEGIAPRLVGTVDRFVVGQDTAVPLAFLITELIGVAARIAAPAPADVRLTATSTGSRATLTITAAGFCNDPLAGSTEPNSRIIHGMARQLRTPLFHDAEAASYSVEFAVPPGGQAGAR